MQTVTCVANFFDTDADASNGCEETCGSVTEGSCNACSAVSSCTDVTCNPNFFDTDNDASNGFEATCDAIADGTCDACSDASTCTNVTCNSNFFNADISTHYAHRGINWETVTNLANRALLSC